MWDRLFSIYATGGVLVASSTGIARFVQLGDVGFPLLRSAGSALLTGVGVGLIWPLKLIYRS